MDWPTELQCDPPPLSPPESPRLGPVKDLPFSSGESYSLGHPSFESLYKNSPSKSTPALPIDPVAGVLSLRNYRKSLFSGSGLVDCPERRTLRRKNAASNLNRTTTPMGTLIQNADYRPLSTSSVTSSPPPPLSPSYSPSALSEQLPELLPELLDGYGYPLSPLADTSYSEGMAGDKQSPYKLLDTFRDRLDRFPDTDAPDIVEFHGHNRARSDSVLWRPPRGRKPPATATVVHQGTSFEILNPHESLDFARIVSYIEDIDCPSTGTRTRDSYLTSSDGSRIISEEPDIYDAPPESPVAEGRAHDDLVGDSAQHPLPSISQRLEESSDNNDTGWDSSTIRPPLSRPLTMIRIGTARDETELGELGPPTDRRDNMPAPLPPSTDLSPFHVAALYDIGHLPAPGKGADTPTAVIYSDRKPIRKRSTIRKNRNHSHKMTSSFSFSPSTTSATVAASTPLKRLRGFAQSLRQKTFARSSLHTA
ncbi:hypothetical protein BDW66DRAFT_112994 [Aspergillus desertorum]